MPISYEEVLEAYPDELDAAIARMKKERSEIANSRPGLAFIVQDIARWPTDDVVTVAFLDGTHDLHEAIAVTAQEISDSCGISLCFGAEPELHGYRRWSVNDTSYRADIRVSFDQSGYWSLVGTDSINTDLTAHQLGVGGAPHQRSLNLGGFDRRLPDGWRRTVLHEFLHALAFSHEHQNPLVACQQDLRWEDDPGYVPTVDGSGRFITDAGGRRPGTYTYLSGAPNNWDRAKVDHNLRSTRDDSTVMSEFDGDSVMLYRFAPLFYKTDPSPCAPTPEGNRLSEGDIGGLQLLYPSSRPDSDDRVDQARMARTALGELDRRVLSGASSPSGLEHILNRLCTRVVAPG